ncbi:MAG: urease accessory protein UreF [Steroidobacteraceae bacterium]
MDRTIMLSDRALYQLLAWNSPAYPTGAFSYSHGLEWAVEEGSVTNMGQLVDFVAAVLTRGGGWVDAVLFVHTWRAATISDPAVDEISELGAAFRGTAETALESLQQGAAFLQITRQAWPHPAIEEFARRHAGRRVAHPVIVGLTCAVHGIELQPALSAYLQAAAANLVSAGVRLIPLGQTHGQLAIARLLAVIESVTEHAGRVGLENLGTAAPGLERCSALHETQYTRLFRS